MDLAGGAALAEILTKAPDLKKLQKMRSRDRATRPTVGKRSASKSPLSDFLTIKLAAGACQKSLSGF